MQPSYRAHITVHCLCTLSASAFIKPSLHAIMVSFFLPAYYPYCCNQFGYWNPMDTQYWQCSDSDAENGLTSCPSFNYNNNYYYYGTAGLFCYSLVRDDENSSGAEVIPTCTHGDVRLIGGTTLNEGRVEICYEGSWSSLCYGIELTTASVICKQLNGYIHLQYAGKNQIFWAILRESQI